MATATKTYTPDELYDLLRLATEFNNEFRGLSFVAGEIPVALADEYATSIVQALSSRGNEYPLGKLLAHLANTYAYLIETEIAGAATNSYRRTEQGISRMLEDGTIRTLE